MRTRRSIAMTAGVLLALAVPGVATAQDATVEVVDSAFDPQEVTVSAGDTVTWTQTGSLPHTVTADDGAFDSHPDCSGGSGCMGQGETFEFTFDEPGTYAYYCKIHGAPGGVGMSGTIVVTAAGDAEPTPTATETTGPGDDAPAVTGSIEVGDQSGDGTAVVVDAVTISGANGFVAVHADDDGAPGAVLGHAPIDEGTTTGLQVPLDEALAGDQSVWPMLHVDAGELGVYEFPGPDGPVMADGQVVMAPLSFTVAVADGETGDDTAGELAETGAPTSLLVALALGLLVVGGAATTASASVRARRSAPEDRPAR